jgi:hypothetical protein
MRSQQEVFLETWQIKGGKIHESGMGFYESTGFSEADGSRSGDVFGAAPGLLGQLGGKKAECAFYGD